MLPCTEKQTGTNRIGAWSKRLSRYRTANSSRCGNIPFTEDGTPLITMVDETTKVQISKQDATTGAELPGATLQVIDENGTVIEEWVSTTEQHFIEAVLTAGKTYTLREITAPNGYQIAEDDRLQREKATYFKNGASADKQILTTTDYAFEKHEFGVYSAVNSQFTVSYTGLRTTKTTYITANKQVTTETLTDFRGNPVEEKTNSEVKRTNSYYKNGQLAVQIDALGNETQYEYNWLNKLTKTKVPFTDNSYSITESKYDKRGNVIKTIQTVQEQDAADEKNSITENKYNALGLLTQVTLKSDFSDEVNISRYFYNNAGIQTKMYTGLSSKNDDAYLTTEYTYDAWMRLVRTTDSTGYNSGSVTYDLNGNVLTTTDANGNVTANTYDALNRVLTSDSVHPTDASKNVSKSYAYDNMGRVTNATSNDVTTTYSYDELGRIYTESEYSSNYRAPLKTMHI